MDRWRNVKVAPSNQTLILAGERAPAAGMSAVGLSRPAGLSGPAGLALPAGLSRPAGSPGNDPVLQRLTIVAARPDSTMVYLRADYAAGDGSAPEADSPGVYGVTGNTLVSGGQTQPSLTRAVVTTPRSDPHASSRGISLYASTQRMSLETVSGVLDVHA
jgi:hypothetical protein